MSGQNDPKISVLSEALLKRIAEDRGGDLMDSNITDLDFSGRIFELESLEGLKYISWKSLKAIDISNNSIDRMGTVLSNFKSLTTILASNNLITRVDFSLPNLTELDLSRNHLKSIPDLSGIPKLERLLLNFNAISIGFNELAPLKNLLLLDLSNNKISFNSNDLKKFLDTLKNLEKLDSLRIYNNPFCSTVPQYEFYFIKAITSLGSINNEIITKDLKNTVNKGKIKPLEQVFKEASDNAKTAENGEVVHNDADQMPKLENLHMNLKLAKNSPMLCLEKFKAVVKDVEKIVNRPSERFVIFKANTPKEQSDIRMHIDSFLQEAVMMIEDLPTMRTPVLRLLALLSEVEEGNFGQKCILTLQDLFGSGPDIELEIKTILKEIILPKIIVSKVDNIPKDLLKGIIRLCKGHDITDMFEGLVETMGAWMRAEVVSEELRLVKDDIVDDSKRETHTYMIILVATAAKNPKIAKLMMNKKIAQSTAKLIKVMDRESEPSNILGKQDDVKVIVKRLKYILRIIENMSKNHIDSANIFITEEIHQKLLREVWDYLVFYKANGYTFSSGSVGAESIEIMYYKLLSAYLDALAGLCNGIKCVEYINHTAQEIRDEILNVSIMPKTDPLLLNSIIDLVNYLLSSEFFDRLENLKTFQHYVEKLQKMLPFLPYLGGKKYKDICLLAEKYAKGTVVGQEAIVISSLTNKYLHKLFIAIIELIMFFSCKAVDHINPEIKSLCISISRTLDANHREDLLFNCLEIPNDSVKLAVVKCLDKIPVEEIDIEETGHIVRILGSYKNLGVGRTEEVLSQIFLLLSKILDNGKKRQDFIEKFGEMVITECLGILLRNQLRNLKLNHEENYEKLFLTVSGVHFLKKCSEHKELYPFMENVRAEDTMREILKAEESFGTYENVPVDIERTWIGSNVEPLLMCFTTNKHLLPYEQVTYRVLQKIANILHKLEPEKTYEIDPKAQNQLERLIDFNKTLSENRETVEASSWPEKGIDNIENTDKFYLQHKKFSDMKGITVILNFLLGRASMKLIELEKKLNTEFDKRFDVEELRGKMNAKVEELTIKFKIQKKKAEDAENKQIDDDEPEYSAANDSEFLRRAMQEQDIYPEEGWEGGDDEYNDYIEGDFSSHELVLRAKILATFLRILIAAIELGPANTRIDAVKQLRDMKNLKALTKLCATTGWKNFTLGAKFLRIIKHIIKISPINNFCPKEDVILYETISIVITQILGIIKQKILNCDREELTKEDTFFIKEIASVGAILGSSVYNFQWSSDIEGIYKERTSVLIKSVQEQAAAYILEQIIPLKNVEKYIEILFYDMTMRERFKQESYSKDPEEVVFMEIARMEVGDILAMFVALSDSCKYRVLEMCKAGVIFHDKVFNVTYLQDIMNKASMILFGIELSKLMKRNHLEFKMEQEEIQERIVNICWGDICEFGSSSFNKVLILVTCRCLYLLEPCNSPPCPLCGEERFCPRPPTYKQHIEFSDMTQIITFPNSSQIFGIEYLKNEEDLKGFIFISKTFNGGKNIASTLISIKEEFSQSTSDENYGMGDKMSEVDDRIFKECLEEILIKSSLGSPVLSVYCSLNPENSIIGMMGGMKIFKRGTFTVLTDKNLLVNFDINLKKWKPKLEGVERGNLDIFSVRSKFDLMELGKVSIKDEDDYKLYMDVDGSMNLFVFGDDYTLEIFQRYLMERVYKVKGGGKLKLRVDKDKKGK